MLRKLVLTIAIVTVITATVGSTAQARPLSSKQVQIQIQLKRWYHADGFIKSIGHVASRTIYSSNSVLRLKWTLRLHKLILTRVDAKHKLDKLRIPAVPHLGGIEGVKAIIRYVFGGYGGQAVEVSRCETGGTFWPGSSNGQYLGIFQMGSSERARYGHGSDALTQARSAYHYFADSGYDWSPWSCKP